MKRKKKWLGPKAEKRLGSRFDDEARSICTHMLTYSEGAEDFGRVLRKRRGALEQSLTIEQLISQVVQRAGAADPEFRLDVGAGVVAPLEARLGVAHEVRLALEDLEAEADPAFKQRLEEERTAEREESRRRRESGYDPAVELAESKKRIREIMHDRLREPQSVDEDATPAINYASGVFETK